MRIAYTLAIRSLIVVLEDDSAHETGSRTRSPHLHGHHLTLSRGEHMATSLWDQLHDTTSTSESAIDRPRIAAVDCDQNTLEECLESLPECSILLN
jgi:hypothetical protein